MRILIYGLNFSPELTGIGKYTGEMAEWLAAHGHEVRVITSPPYYPDWKVREGYSGHGYRVEGANSQGFMTYRCPLWVPARPSGLKRLLHLASFAISSLPVLLRQAFWRPDLVWVVEPALFCAPGAWLIARLSGARCWLHIQDYEVDAAFDLGLLKGERLRRWVTASERWLMRRFDRVSTISKRMIERALSKGIDPARITLFPNWVDISGIQPLTQPSSFRAELGIPNEAVVALYSGNMGNKQGLEILADAARLLQNQPHLHFVFCGNGAGRDDLIQRTAGLERVYFLDLQPLERLSDLLGLADLHLLPQRADAADLVMPSKLTGMLASGRPVVATAHPGTELASVVSRCGVIVPPEEPPVFAAAIAALAADSERRRALGAAGRRFAEDHLAHDAVLQSFVEEAEQCLSLSRSHAGR